MALKKIEPGASYRLVSDYGVGPGSIPAGADLKVTGIYPPGTPGIGYSNEDTVLAEYDRPGAPPQTIAVARSVFSQMVKAV